MNVPTCARCRERIATRNRNTGQPLDTPRCPNAAAHYREDTIALMRRINAEPPKYVVLGGQS